MHGKDTTMVASFITPPPLERALVNTERDRERESPLSIGSELSLILLRERVRSMVDFCNKKIAQIPAHFEEGFWIAYARWSFGGLFCRQCNRERKWIGVLEDR